MTKPVPVEPEVVKNMRGPYGGETIKYIDALKAYALKEKERAQYEFRARERLQFTINKLEGERADWSNGEESQRERAEKAEAINRRMVEQYRDLVAAAEKIGGKVTDASNLQISIADVLSMKEALAKLEEACRVNA